MPARKVRADHMAARLSAAGFTPRVTHRTDQTRIETEVPDAVSADSWRDLLAVLETADSFGLVVGDSGRTAWAAVSEETPATASTVRGHGHQP
ncbi:hypothetical protein AB0H73_01755 [Streptomyces olivoreticuli]